jgi:predicted AAA+ superfamily ATPase
MNEYISRREMIYTKRRIAPIIRQIATALPVVVVTGARQVGKSTMLRNEFADYDYVTLDDYALLEQARLDPQSLWVGRDKIIIDEAQKCPQIFHAIKLAVDASDRRKQFIISGSANLYLMEKVTESLAGRAIYVDLLPMTFGEAAGIADPGNFPALWRDDFPQQKPTPPDVNLPDLLLRGFMPPVMTMQSHNQVLTWLDGYVKTYLERDLRELSQVESLIDFRKVMQCLSLRTGNILNQADVAKDCGLSHPTTHRYIKLLEVSNIISRVPAYYASRSKRLVKSPKVFFLDPALSIFLSGYTDRESLAKSRELGGFFETLVYLHLRSLCELMTPRAAIYYWRTSTSREVDFVIEHGRKVLPIEVKLNGKPTPADAANLLAFLDEHPQAAGGVVVHGGDELFRLHSKVVAVPWWWLDG